MSDTSQHESVAAAYAKALLATTEKSGSTADVLSDLESLVRDVLDQQPKFAAALASPRLSTEEKLGLIDKVFGGRLSPELLRFVKVVARHERLAALPAISRTYRRLVNDALGRAAVTVITAEPLAADLRSQVTATLEARLGKPIDLTTQTDPSLLGGMVVRVGDTVYDASVAGRLDRQRRGAIKNSARRLQNK